MWPRIGSLPTFGILYLTGIILHFLVSRRIAKRYGLKRRVWIAASMCYLVGMTLGAKLLFDLRRGSPDVIALFQPEHYLQGGLWGGLLAYLALAVPAVLLLAQDKRSALDLVGSAIPIPWIVTKLGCLLHGDCYGKPCSLPWAITFPEGARGAPAGIPLHPTQLYEVGIMLVILLVFARLRSDRWRGTRLLWFLLIYGFGRAASDFLRGDTESYLYPGLLTLTQLLCIVAGSVALVVLAFLRYRQGHPAPSCATDSRWTREIMAYEFNGEEYTKASAHQKQWGLELIEQLDLRGDERILDLGCGDGELTARLALRVPRGRALGIDASQGMIDTARKHAAPNLEFALKDINLLDYENEFDVVFSNATLHWIKDHRRLLRNVHRALRAGGVIRLNFAADGNCSHFFHVVRNAMTLPPYHSDFRDFSWPWFMPTIEQYRDLMSQSEFSEVRVWLENADHWFADAEAMIRWVDQPSLVPFLTHLPEAHRRPFRDLVVEQMVRETLQEDGRCFETFRRINVFGRKHG